jgi:hypothetical protein
METYAKEIMKRATKPKQYARVITKGDNDIFALDLAEMGEWANSNSGYKYIMVVVDCFSRYMWAVPLATKNASDTWNAISPILTRNKPNKIWCDQGKEFYNSIWAVRLKQLGIIQYSTTGEYKASIAERAIRTLKTMLWNHFIQKNTRNWTQVLQDTVDKYNHTKHSTIDMTPVDATDYDNEKELWAKQYPQEPEGKPKYKLGQWVRISRVKGRFEKGFHPNWSYEIYKIISRKLTVPVMYYLQDYYGEPVIGGFYEEQVQPVADPSFFPVEKVLKTRTYKGEKQKLSKLLGYKDPVWLKADDVGDLT